MGQSWGAAGGADAGPALLACERGADETARVTAQLRFLTNVTGALAAAIDDESMFRQVARLVVPAVADWCAVHLVEPDGTRVRRVAVVHVDARKQAAAERLLSPELHHPTVNHAVSLALRSLSPQLVEGSGALAPDGPPEAIALYEEIGTTTALTLPMTARNRPVGVLTLALGDSGRRYRSDDIALAEELARRCALAVDNARLYQEARRLLADTDRALTLLDTLFANAPIGLAFLDLDGNYVKANEAMAGMDALPAAERAALHRRVLDTGAALVDVEVEGEATAWLTSWFPVRSGDGTLVGVGLVGRDITDRKRAEAELRQRAAQQAAVAEFGRMALAGTTVDELYREALATLTTTLGVSHAAVIEEVGAGQGRIRAVRGWPLQSVGQVVPAGTGSQAGYTLLAGDPVVVEDVRTEARFSPAPVTLAEGLVSSMSTVVRGIGRNVGVLSVHTQERRHFTVDDVNFLRSIANVLAAALARSGAEEELRQEQERLQLALDAGHMGNWEWDIANHTVRWSESLERIFGLLPGAFGRTFDDYLALIHPDDREMTVEAVQRALTERRPLSVEHRVRFADGSEHWIHGVGRVVVGEDDEPVAMIGVAADVTERVEAERARAGLLEAERAARAEAEAARSRLEFLAEASAVLSTSLNYRRTLAKVANLAVPRLADWCSVDVVEEDPAPNQMAIAHSDPEKVALARELRRRYPVDPDAARGAPYVIRTGQSQLIPVIDDSILVEVAVDADHLAMLRELGLHSVMIVPMMARGRPIGAITLVSAESRRVYGPEDLAFAEDLARRAGAAIDNARLYQERSLVARALQQSLLPPEMPFIPGLEVAARYRPMSEQSEIGGDFYDVFQARDGSWCFVVGDVCGKGPEAAAVTGLARSTTRAVALHDPTPTQVLGLLNEALYGNQLDSRFCTVAFARVVPSSGGGAAMATVSCGGHPLPFVVRRKGPVEAVGTAGTLLGVFENPALDAVDVTLEPGDALVFYTDGVTEARRRGQVFGEARLGDLLRSVAGAEPDVVADAIEDAILTWQPEHRSDDLALLVIRAPG